MPLISLLVHEDGLITVLKGKVELFNCFFSKQCSLIADHNKVPLGLMYATSA